MWVAATYSLPALSLSFYILLGNFVFILCVYRVSVDRMSCWLLGCGRCLHAGVGVARWLLWERRSAVRRRTG